MNQSLETFQLYSTGRIKPGSTLSSVRRELKKLHLSDKQIANLTAGQPKVIKAGLDVSQAKRYIQAFSKSGLDVSLLMKLNKQCFEEGLQVNNVQISSEDDWQTWLLDKATTLPTILSVPTLTRSMAQDGSDFIRVKSNSFFINPLIMLVSILFASFYLQQNIQSFLSQTLAFSWFSYSSFNFAFTALFIVFCIAFFIKFSQPRTCIEFSRENEEKALLLLEKFTWRPFSSTFYMINAEGLVIGLIHRKIKSIYVAVRHGKRKYYWEREDTEKKLRTMEMYKVDLNVIDKEALDKFAEQNDILKKARHALLKKDRHGEAQWNPETAKIIFDQSDSPAAIVYREPYPAIQVRKKVKSDIERFELIALGMCILRI